jgi:predicted Zn finger-like uncharacterized protein
MTVSCPDCRSVFRVDPAKVPATGVRARCSVCGGVIAIAGGTLPISVTPASIGAVPSPARVANPTPSRPYTPAAAVPAVPAGSAMMTPPAPGRMGGSPFRRPTPIQSPAQVALGAGIASAPSGATTASATGASPAVPSAVGSPATAPTSEARPTPGVARPTPAHASALAAPSGTASAPVPSLAGAATTTAIPTPRRAINPFLNADPGQRARRLARALVSDLVAYHPQKREEGLRDGTLRQLFREDIKKSYEEYVEQVGRDVAEASPHFQEALNEILGGGRKLF